MHRLPDGDAEVRGGVHRGGVDASADLFCEVHDSPSVVGESHREDGPVVHRSRRIRHSPTRATVVCTHAQRQRTTTGDSRGRSSR